MAPIAEQNLDWREGETVERCDIKTEALSNPAFDPENQGLGNRDLKMQATERDDPPLSELEMGSSSQGLPKKREKQSTEATEDMFRAEDDDTDSTPDDVERGTAAAPPPEGEVDDSFQDNDKHLPTSDETDDVHIDDHIDDKSIYSYGSCAPDPSGRAGSGQEQEHESPERGLHHEGYFHRPSISLQPRRGSSFKFLRGRGSRPLNQRSRREYIFVLCAGLCLSFNSGYINGCCMSGLLDEDGSRRQAVSAFTGTYTKSGLALASGDGSYFGFEFSMILCFICGSFVSGMMNPKAVPHQLGPTYGPIFLVASVLLFIASVMSAIDPRGKTLFFFAAAANGMQNGMTSTYSANLIRTSHLTGTSTDIGLFLGQMVRGEMKNAWKFYVLTGLATSFWLGSFISFFAVRRLRSLSLLLNAIFFLCIGLGCIIFMAVTHHITIWQAAAGSWHWDRALETLNISVKDGEDPDDDGLMEVFDTIDADNNGFIEKAELYTALKAAGMHITRKSVAGMFEVADKDQDGRISRNEFRQLVLSKTSNQRWDELINQETKKDDEDAES